MLCGVAVECHDNLQYLQAAENSLSLLWWTQGAHNCETYLRKGSESKLCRNCRVLMKFQETGSIGRRLGSGRPSKIQCNCRDKENYWRTNASGRRDYSPLAIQVADKQKLQDQSLYLLWCRTSLEWTFRGTSYWQLIHLFLPYSAKFSRDNIFTDQHLANFCRNKFCGWRILISHTHFRRLRTLFVLQMPHPQLLASRSKCFAQGRTSSGVFSVSFIGAHQLHLSSQRRLPIDKR